VSEVRSWEEDLYHHRNLAERTFSVDTLNQALMSTWVGELRVQLSFICALVFCFEALASFNGCLRILACALGGTYISLATLGDK